MSSPQSGIFALGTSSHAFLELDVGGDATDEAFVGAIAGLREPRTTIGGVNLVAGFRPERWRSVAPDDTPSDLAGFNEAMVGPDDFTMPATQHDAVLWLSGGSYDVVFDTAYAALAELGSVAAVATETACWPYHHDRDLTGFVDGSENPSLIEAADVALVPAGRPGAAGTVLLLQKWQHDAARWGALAVDRQEQAMGRTKQDSIELDDKPATSHVARTDQDTFGKVFRRNMPYGTVTDHGTMFVGFSAEQARLATMLESMAGITEGIRDEITRFTSPLTGAYYFVPSTDAIATMTGDGSTPDR